METRLAIIGCLALGLAAAGCARTITPAGPSAIDVTGLDATAAPPTDEAGTSPDLDAIRSDDDAAVGLDEDAAPTPVDGAVLRPSGLALMDNFATGDGGDLAVHAAMFRSGTWTQPVLVGDGVDVCSGLCPLDDGRVLLVGHAASDNGLRSAVWSGGAWSPLRESLAAFSSPTYSAPVPTRDGAVLVRSISTPPTDGSQPLMFGGATEVWTSPGTSDTLPATGASSVAALGNGTVLFVGYWLRELDRTYAFARGLDDGWSSGISLGTMGAAPVDARGASVPATALARLARDGTAIALFATGTGDTPTIHSSVYDDDTYQWTAPVDLGLATRADATPDFAVTGLPDGRAAAVVRTNTGDVVVGFFDGARWGAFRDVPAVVPRNGGPQFALAPGVDPGVVLELVYMASASGPTHVRLTNESAWTWTAPVVIDPSAGGWITLSMTALP